ncbi:MAG TPA: tol-pal system protein YbgF, partial [Nitrosomonas sp.]|nr:tol-pal system protein YbgF [Nitrosomonas sp.]
MVLRASSFLVVALLLVSKPSIAGLFGDEKAREQIDLLQKQTQAMEARIAGMEELLKSNALIELYSQVEGFKIELGKLTGQIEVLTEENKLLRKQQKDFYLDLDNRLNQVESEGSRESGNTSLGEPDSSTALPSEIEMTAQTVDGSEREAYQTGYNLFREGDYLAAISHFEQFLKQYASSSLAPGAAYWIGNAHYALRNFQEAISAQQRVIDQYPKSAKAPDALLNIASSQLEIPDVSAAKKTLEN